jgi:rod shape-determining protein MreC
MPVSPGTSRNRVILIVIIIICIAVITLYVRESDKGPLHSVQGFFLDLFSPVGRAFSKIFKPIKDGVVNVFHLPSLSKERADLQKEVEQLRRDRIEARELEAENQELKELLKWTEQKVELETVGADIVGQSPDNWQRLMIINKGSSSGIKKYMAVVTEQGLIGRIISVGARSSVVQLITDSRSGIGARSQTTRETGIVEGQNEEILRFVAMKEDAEVKVGDIMETSGLGGTCPSGIGIGRVSNVKKRPSGLARLVEVKPFVKFSKLEQVLVIITPEPESVILKESQ